MESINIWSMDLTNTMCVTQIVAELYYHYFVVCSADEEQQRDVVRAAGPPQRVVEERGEGMPRRRRNMATAMANRRPQREAVEPGMTCIRHCIH